MAGLIVRVDYQCVTAFESFGAGSWGALATVGVLAIVGGSVLERHGHSKSSSTDLLKRLPRTGYPALGFPGGARTSTTASGQATDGKYTPENTPR